MHIRSPLKLLLILGFTIACSGSLFAFNIDTSINNALQIIERILITPGGLFSSSPFMTIDGSGSYVSIGTTSSGETLNLSGTSIISNQTPYGEFGFISNDTIFGGTPGAGSYATSGNEFVFAGTDHDGNKISAELAYNSGNISQFVGVSEDGVNVLRQSQIPSLHTNGIHITSTGIQSYILPQNIGSAAFTWFAGGIELMRVNNSGHVGIGTGDPNATLSVSGSFLAQHNLASITLSPGLSSGNIFYPLPTASLIITDPNAVGLNNSIGIESQISVFDTRGINNSDPKVGAIMATFSPNAFNQTERASVSVHNAREIALDVEGANYHTSLDMEEDKLEIYSSGGFASMYFDGILGLFGFGGNVPGNTIDIASAYVPGTAGLRFSHWTSSSGQILGLNQYGDVVLLGNIGSFGGGGGSNYWTQNGNDLYPTTLSNNIGIGTNTPNNSLSVSGTSLMTNGSRGREFFNDTMIPGLRRIGGWFASGTEYVQQSIVDVFNGVPIANMGWYDTNTNEESNFTAFRQNVTMHYNSDRTNLNAGLHHGIDIDPSGIEIQYDDNNISGDYANLSLSSNGFIFDLSGGLSHIFNRSGFVGINNTNPSHTLTVSGAFVANDGGQGFESSTDILGMNMPGALASVSSGNILGFLFSGIPGANPIFNAGIGAYLGYVDMNTSDRTIIQAQSGYISMGIYQGGNNTVEVNMTPLGFSVQSNNGWDNMFIDFIKNGVGINTAMITSGVSLEINNVLRLQPIPNNQPFSCVGPNEEGSIFMYNDTGGGDSYLCYCGKYASSYAWRTVSSNIAAGYCGNP